MLVSFILLCVAVMIISIMATPKPPGWIALALTVIALILFLIGGPHLRW